MSDKKEIAVFVSGNGTNLQVLIDRYKNSNKFNIRYVISDNERCYALKRAELAGIETLLIEGRNNSGGISYRYLLQLLTSSGINLIVLAGFLKLIPSEFITHFKNPIINLHPSLLPFFGGKGMYGIKVHEAVLKSGMKYSGCTVHLVSEQYDEGAILEQDITFIGDCNTAEEIAERVHILEYELLAKAIENLFK